MQLFQRALYSTFFFFSFQVYGQIAIDNNSFTVNQLVDGILIPAGSGTTISNVTFSGVYNNAGRYQIGHFSTATSTLADMQFAEGIVLSSGNTSDLPLALGTDPGSVAQMSTGYTSCTPGEIRRTGTCGVLLNDLDVLSEGENYFNAAILEFDFVPVNDFVEFRYVFGGEEYMDDIGFINYQCTEFNDRFGFLISGPGIAAGQGFDNDAENIATLANGSFVGINSVNNGIVGSSAVPNGASFCQNTNPSWLQNASTAEYGGIIDGTQLNGNTIALTASKTNLIPGQTYHIKLLITDVSDAAYDAVVYLEAGSFTTEAPCGISAITAGTQTACDPLTNEYTQEVTVTFTNPPATGNLVVNGQAFAIGTSPQTVVLTGLTSDGLSVDVTANFDALPGCSLTVTDLFTAPTVCTPTPCGISAITSGTQTACDPLTNEYTQEVTVTFTNPPATGNLVVNGQAFAIGTSPQTVVLTGLTSDGLSVDVNANFDALPGCSLTVTNVFTAPTDCTPTPCGISAITASTQTACDPLTNEYTQEVTVTFTNPPATGNLVVNGQAFAIGTSPQTLVLTGLASDGLGVDVTANFDALPGCSITVTDVFTAPTDCTPTPCGISAITASTQTACDPLTNEYTQEVTVTFTNPPATGNLVVNGQAFAIGTSPQTVVLTGLTSDGLSVDVTANFDALPGCSLTVTDVFTAPTDCTPTPCGISAITAGTQTACDPLTNEYTQEVTVTFTNPPATGNLVVNGQTFVIGTSPQTVVLTGLTSDGLSVDVTANFDADLGCILTISDLFTAPTDCNIECGELYVPTAFSPNGDQNNDTYMFRLNELCVESMNLSIYNRWGERVFISEHMSNEWDGTYREKPAENGVYVYKLIIKIAGEPDERVLTGNVNLIR